MKSYLITLCIIFALTLPTQQSFWDWNGTDFEHFFHGYLQHSDFKFKDVNSTACFNDLNASLSQIEHALKNFKENGTEHIGEALEEIGDALQKVELITGQCIIFGKETLIALKNYTMNATNYLAVSLNVLFRLPQVRDLSKIVDTEFGDYEETHKDKYFAGEALANLTNAIFSVDPSVVDFMHGWRGRNDTLPPTKIKKIAACIRGVKKMYNTVQVVVEAFKKGAADVIAVISSSLETILTAPFTTKVCYYAFKDDDKKQEQLLLSAPVAFNQHPCDGAVYEFMTSLGSAIVRHENGQATAEDAKAFLQKAGKVSKVCQEKHVVSQ